MKRIQLAMARARKHWTLEEAAEHLLIDVNTLSRWEHGKVRPRSYNVQRLCEVYGATAVALGLEEPLITEPLPSPACAPTESEEEDSLHDAVATLLLEDMTLRLLKIVWAWPRRNTRYTELQQLIVRETEDYKHVNQNDAHAISRRDALRRLALLPIELCGLTTLASVFKSPHEEILTQCSAGITACSYLSKGQHEDMMLAASVISTYLPTLQAIVKDVPLYRKQAASLTAQALLIKATLNLHTLGPRHAARSAEQAVTYSEESDDLPLRLAVLKRLAWIYSCNRQKKQALETVLQAGQILEKATVPVASVIQCDVYGGIAKYQAQSGQNDDALTALCNAHEAFFTPRDDDSGSAYADYNRSTLFLEDGLTRYYAGQYEQAFTTFAQAIDPETLTARIPASSERVRVEIINHQTLASLKSPKKEMELSLKLWKAGIQGAIALQSEQRFTEATNAFEIMEGIWSGDKRVGELRDLIIHW